MINDDDGGEEIGTVEKEVEIKVEFVEEEKDEEEEEEKEVEEEEFEVEEEVEKKVVGGNFCINFEIVIPIKRIFIGTIAVNNFTQIFSIISAF